MSALLLYQIKYNNIYSEYNDTILQHLTNQELGILQNIT